MKHTYLVFFLVVLVAHGTTAQSLLDHPHAANAILGIDQLAQHKASPTNVQPQDVFKVLSLSRKQTTAGVAKVNQQPMVIVYTVHESLDFETAAYERSEVFVLLTVPSISGPHVPLVPRQPTLTTVSDSGSNPGYQGAHDEVQRIEF